MPNPISETVIESIDNTSSIETNPELVDQLNDFYEFGTVSIIATDDVEEYDIVEMLSYIDYPGKIVASLCAHFFLKEIPLRLSEQDCIWYQANILYLTENIKSELSDGQIIIRWTVNDNRFPSLEDIVIIAD